MTEGGARLRAGTMTCVLDGADVRDLRVGPQRVLTRLYIAVRDESWNTIPFVCTLNDLSAGPDYFKAQLACSVDEPPIRAEWGVTVEGSSAGQFSYLLNGHALSDFRFAKLGLNLHHPLPECLGSHYVARRGPLVAKGVIPSLVEPQYFIDGKLTGMFMPFEELLLRGAADDEVVFRFTGDEFEMQDHRNWTDYNLKSYGTPLEVPLPLVAEPGQAINQSVSVDMSRARGLRARAGTLVPANEEAVQIDRSHLAKLPRLGSEFPDELEALPDGTAPMMSELGLDYVRLNLDLTTDEGPRASAVKARQVSSWGLPLELTLVVSTGEARPEEMARLGRWLGDVRPQIERVVVLESPRGFIIGRTASPGAKVRAYRAVIEDRCGAAALVSATEQFFAELNRWTPDLAGVDGVGYTICPQVHAADDISLMENSWGQRDTVATARARAGGRPVHVTSVAMVGKFGPYPAGVPDVPVKSAYGDSRQHDLFGAAWTVSSLRQLVDAEAASATYYELAGDRGLVSSPSDEGTPAFVPVARVLEAVLAWRGANLVRVGTVLGAAIVGLGAEWPERSELLVANLTQAEKTIGLTGLSGEVNELSQLCRGSAGSSTWAPVPPPVSKGPGAAIFSLKPYGVGRLRTG